MSRRRVVCLAFSVMRGSRSPRTPGSGCRAVYFLKCPLLVFLLLLGMVLQPPLLAMVSRSSGTRTVGTDGVGFLLAD